MIYEPTLVFRQANAHVTAEQVNDGAASLGTGPWFGGTSSRFGDYVANNPTTAAALRCAEALRDSGDGWLLTHNARTDHVSFRDPIPHFFEGFDYDCVQWVNTREASARMHEFGAHGFSIRNIFRGRPVTLGEEFWHRLIEEALRRRKWPNFWFKGTGADFSPHGDGLWLRGVLVDVRHPYVIETFPKYLDWLDEQHGFDAYHAPWAKLGHNVDALNSRTPRSRIPGVEIDGRGRIAESGDGSLLPAPYRGLDDFLHAGAALARKHGGRYFLANQSAAPIERRDAADWLARICPDVDVIGTSLVVKVG